MPDASQRGRFYIDEYPVQYSTNPVSITRLAISVTQREFVVKRSKLSEGDLDIQILMHLSSSIYSMKKLSLDGYLALQIGRGRATW